ncbi:MAG: PEP-CTERM sorting domain-containing protein [Calothrix sp. MO_167.B12]|nr:PEP-CTERM sorting domain-containing protein [Calothrix sp. MO_167.B12]
MSLLNTITKLLFDKSALTKILSTTTLLLAITSIGSNANAATLNWNDLGWSSVKNGGKYDSTDSGTVFRNVDGSGIDVTVEYSNNMWNGEPNLYERHPLNDTYKGTLRFTNDKSEKENTWLKLTFSEVVNIDEMWIGSLSTIRSNRREWLSFAAYSGTEINENNLVKASNYNTFENFFGGQTGSSTAVYEDNADTPSLVSLDTDFGTANDDAVYTTYGIGNQVNNLFGRVFFEYNNQAVQTLYIQNFATDPRREGDTPEADDSRSSGKTSVAIGQSIVFRKADQSQKVPEPSLVFGLLLVAGISKALKHRLV